MEAVVSISRDSLALPALNIYDDCEDNHVLWITMNGLARPNFDFKRSYSPNSWWVSGQQLLAAGQEPSSFTLSLIINGIDHTDLDNKMAELEQATSQLAYTITLEIDGQTKTWDADSSLPQWGVVEYLLQDLVKVRGTLTIPIYT